MSDPGALPCPCQSGRPYSECCKPVHGAPASALQPDQVMRARYSAYVMKLESFLRATWHPDTRPAGALCDTAMHWHGLTVHQVQTHGDQGQVHFCAVGKESGNWIALHENSRFCRANGVWLYLDGKTDYEKLHPGRNDPCPCGSGVKTKKCCP